MKTKMNISIQRRIYLSFSLLVCVFVLNGVITIFTINNNKKFSARLSKVVEPSLQSLKDLEKTMLESKMYSTNWVFLRSNQEDKKLLKRLHDSDYVALKSRISTYASYWVNKNWVDSLNKVFDDFEKLLAIEKNIMSSLKEFNDYDDPVIKLGAERKIEEDVLPRTAALINSLNAINAFGSAIREEDNTRLESSSMRLRLIIIILSIAIVCIGFFLSMYMTRVIISPVNKIRLLINDLGKGILRKTDHNGTDDEISKMVLSVNNLSGKLQATATFAHETGLRNFDMPFTPLSDEDTLGKALLSMRENLKAGETNLALKNRELERKNKELEEFAFVASHDLQEPLRTASSFVDLFQKHYKGKLDERADKYLSFISQASDRMQVLITDLLEYSRIGSKKEINNIDCNIILTEVLADLHTAINESGTKITAGPLPVVLGYRTELKQLFQNLISNSIKFREKDRPPLITIAAWKDHNNWQFSFSDNGIGIAKEHYEKIFVIFQRLHTRNQYKGSGIGLSLCKKIVELHKGKIWPESVPDKGCTFYFTLPVSPAPVFAIRTSEAGIQPNNSDDAKKNIPTMLLE